MNLSVLYFLIAVGIAFLIAGFQYIFFLKKYKKRSYVLILLRFVSVLAILTLIINPKWERIELSNQKPNLIIGIDNSASIAFNKEIESINNIKEIIKKDERLNEKFDIEYFSFGESVQLLDTLTFEESKTDQTQFLKEIGSLYKEDQSSIILVTDGNQTIGNSYEYFSSKKPVYPLVIGDTTQYSDLSVTQINSNQYTFLDNKFPLEIYTLYKGAKSTDKQLFIYKNNKRIYTEIIHFSPDNNSKSSSVLLPAKELGQHFYQVVIEPLKNEKNQLNNKRDFSIEVVDQKSDILILSSFHHPDLGAIKNSIESNKQRKVSIEIGGGSNIDYSAYQLIVIYQPTPVLASSFKKIDKAKINTILITGSKTDWEFLNAIQNNFSNKSSQVTEDFLPIYNSSFSEFVTQDIGFDKLPPLKGIFGSTNFKIPHEVLLYQKIGNTVTDEPLLVTYIVDTQKNAILFGENIWRWRMINKIENQSFNVFDNFWEALVQYATSSKKTKQLHLDYNKVCYSNQEQLLKASFFDKNYQIDKNASIWLHLTHNNNKLTEKFPFSLNNDHYQVTLSDLIPGDYNFDVIVSEKNSKTSGSFKVLNYNIEQQFITANTQKLMMLAERSGGALVYEDSLELFLQTLVNDESFKSIQKRKKISKALIDWHWLLAIIILSLTIEWFIRKYRGLI